MLSSAHSTEPRRIDALADPVEALIDRLADHLAPLFVTGTSDLAAARMLAMQTIVAYHPGTQADLIDIARMMSFSMSALAALARASAEALTPQLQLRYLSQANALTRSADQSERAMARRRRYQHQQTHDPAVPFATLRSAPPDLADSATDPQHDDQEHPQLSEQELERGQAEIEAAVADAMLSYTRNSEPRVRFTAPPWTDEPATAANTGTFPGPFGASNFIPRRMTEPDPPAQHQAARL